MNAVEDKELSREGKKALIVFLFAEMKRHQLDIEHIQKSVGEVCEQLGISERELKELEEKSERYVRF